MLLNLKLNRATEAGSSVALNQSPAGSHPRQSPLARLEYPVVHRHTRSEDHRENWSHAMLNNLYLGNGFGVPAPLVIPRLLIA